VAVTTMLAWPRPFSSAPVALRTSRLAASSRSAISAVPPNWSRTGPIRMATRPLYFSPPEVLGQFRAGQAGGYLGDVPEELPDLLDRLGDLEVVGDQHRLSFRYLRRVFLERPAAPGAAEVVGLALVLQRIAGRVLW